MRTLALLAIAFAAPVAAQDCSVSPWKVEVMDDPMQNSPTCMVMRADPREAVGGLVVTKIGTNTHFSVLGSKPRLSPALIRVDGNEPIYVNERLNLEHFDKYGRELYQQLRSGTTVRTQHGVWPGGGRIDKEAPICDLIAKIESCPK